MEIKIAFLIIVVSVSNLLATETYSQVAKVSLDMEDRSLDQVMDEIEKQSEFYFIFNQKQIDVHRKVDIQADGKLITDILPELFKGTNVQYAVLDRKILLTTEPFSNSPPVFVTGTELQQRAITGTVSDASTGDPMPGVNILVKGTLVGAMTDIDGKFTITAPDPDVTTLVISFIGYGTQEIAVSGRTSINISLEAEVLGLDEVVVIGYGTQKKTSLTGAISTVDEKSLRLSTSSNAASRMQGRISGVTITNDNSPGGDATVRIRGFGSVNNSDPLYIIDGVPITGGLSQMNPNDIESISVLKDASASAIYGARAANGVIIVTTRRATSGIEVNFESRVGLQRATNQLDMANTQEYAEITWMEFKNAGLQVGNPGWGSLQYGYGPTPVIPDYIFPAGKMEGEVDESTYTYPTPYNGITKANKIGTNWFDEVFRKAVIQEYDLAMRSGTDRSKYSVSFNYRNEEGAVIYTGFKRYATRVNTEFKITDWLEVGENIGITYSNRVSFGNNSADNPVSHCYRMQPIVPVYDIMGNFAGTQSPTTGDAENPVAILYRDKDDVNQQIRLLGSVYIQSKITNGLLFKSLVGIDYRSGDATNRYIKNTEGIKAALNDRLTKSFSGGNQYNWTNTLNYSKTFNRHYVNVLVGSEAVANRSESFSAARSTYAFTNLDFMILDAGESDQAASGSFNEWRTLSFFGRLNYTFNDKYLIEAVIRRDGSSRFDEKSRWGTFPAISVGWVLSRESFMENLTVINELKLRGGWGKNGNDNVSNYNSWSTYRSSGSNSYYNIQGANSTSSQAGYYKYRLGNANVNWESTETINIGLDLAIFNNKFAITFDAYSRITKDMLYRDTKPDTWGSPVLPSINIGEMLNNGFDIKIIYRSDPRKDFVYDITANLTHYRNELIALNDNPNEILYGSDLRGERYTVSKQGFPFSSYFGYVVEGIFNTWEEVAAHPKYFPTAAGEDKYSQPGVFKFKDVNKDGVINSDDRTIIGNPHPKLFYGINFGLNYKNLDATMFFQGVQGVDVMNYTARWTDFQQFQGGHSKRRRYESWTQERYESGAKITMPMALANDSPMQKPSTYFVENGAYLRMKNLQIGYSLPPNVGSRIGIKSMRVYFQTDNLFTITKYRGLDPEARAGNDINLGVDQGIYPTMQTTMLGVNLSF